MSKPKKLPLKGKWPTTCVNAAEHNASVDAFKAEIKALKERLTEALRQLEQLGARGMGR